MTLAEMNDEFGAAKTNKKEFLEKMSDENIQKYLH